MPEQTTTLREMIAEALSNGATYRKLAAQARDAGEKASHSIFFDIVAGNLDRVPTEANLRGIAAGLRMPYEVVRQAAITQWIPADEDQNAERERRELLAEAKRLRDQANETIARLEQQERDEEQSGGRRAG